MMRSVSVNATNDGVVRFPWSGTILALAEVCSGDEGLTICNDVGAVVLEDTDTRVGRAQIDTDGWSHGDFVRGAVVVVLCSAGGVRIGVLTRKCGM